MSTPTGIQQVLKVNLRIFMRREILINFTRIEEQNNNDQRIQKKTINKISLLEFKKTAGKDASESWWAELPDEYRNNPSNNFTYRVSEQNVLHFTQVKKFSQKFPTC